MQADFGFTPSGKTALRVQSGQRIAMRQGGTLIWLLGDHLGSATITATENGTLASEQKYTAWGQTRSGSVGTDRQYTGQISEPQLGLYFYNARFYDSYLARFIQADSIIPQPGSPLAWDRYAYVNSNPVRYTDPSGHRACGDLEELNCDGIKHTSIKKSQSYWMDPVTPMDVGGGYTYNSSTHRAIDLNPDNEENPNPAIISSTYGVVHTSSSCIDPCNNKLVGSNAGYGNVIIIEYYYASLPPEIQALVEEGSSIFILYAHLSEPSKLKNGDIVSPGQEIGNVGTTGNSTGVHLHLQIRIQISGKRFEFEEYANEKGYTIIHSMWHDTNVMEPQDPNGFFTINPPK